MKILFALITFVIFTYQCGGIEVECEYKLIPGGGLECELWTGYFCAVQNSPLVTSKDDQEVTSIKVKGQHLNDKDEADVKGFIAEYKTVNFFPRGLTKFFRNIKHVLISNSTLEEVSKEDLREFGANLKRLWLEESKIEIIEADLFEFNPNLECIDLHSNKIKHISDGAFTGLKKLKSFSLNNNPCSSGDDWALYDPQKALTIIEKLETKCKDWNLFYSKNPLTKLHPRLTALELQISSLFKLIEEQNSKLQETILKIGQKVEDYCMKNEEETSTLNSS